jgi:2-polyprenyl-6-methoxyphenol hydroxylase-like FAD-dependent oxidoreductase
VHNERGCLGTASFGQIAGPWKFILSLPQNIQEGMLWEKLAAFPTVQMLRETEVTSVSQEAELVSAEAAGIKITADWLIACDGHRSTIRSACGITTHGGDYGCHFSMADFKDASPLGLAAHLWFTRSGAVESFPLGGGLRRWIVQTQNACPAKPDEVQELVAQRTPHRLAAEAQTAVSSFSPRWQQASRLRSGRVLLAGDAARVMSPIGGQGMNTGWADAEFLAECFQRIYFENASPETLFAFYEKIRIRAGKVATRRAHQGMWLGTRTGRFSSFWRDFALKYVLFRPPLSRALGPHFAMQTIPGNLWRNAQKLAPKRKIPLRG